MAALTLELVHITAGGAVFLWAWEAAGPSGPWGPALILPEATYFLEISLLTSSEPSAQS